MLAYREIKSLRDIMQMDMSKNCTEIYEVDFKKEQVEVLRVYQVIRLRQNFEGTDCKLIVFNDITEIKVVE